MIVDDKSAGEAFRALGDLAESLATSVEAMTRIAIALQPNRPTAPSTLLTNPITCAAELRADKD